MSPPTTPQKIIVFQSFRTVRVPTWITRCMETVRAWTKAQGYDYEFVDDALFELCPPWFREKAKGHHWPLSDLGRLLKARQLVREGGYDRAIWMDADVAVFDEAKLKIDTTIEHQFCREPYILRRHEPLRPTRKDLGRPSRMFTLRRWRPYTTAMNVNNAVFCVGDTWLLNTYIESVLCAAKEMEKLAPQHFGPDTLTALHKAARYPLIRHIGCFSDVVMADLGREKDAYPRRYAQLAGEPMYAANLCATARLPDSLYDHAVERLVQSKGEIINRFV